jgi:quercetin dioxygenase-like cupin family protein
LTLGNGGNRGYGDHMQKISIEALARQQIAAAVAAPSGRAADTAFGGHEKRLRQTVMAFRAGTQLSEHQNPGEATVLVLKGTVWLKAGSEAWQGKAGDLLIVPNGLHSLTADEDSAVLFPVVKTDR